MKIVEVYYEYKKLSKKTAFYSLIINKDSQIHRVSYIHNYTNNIQYIQYGIKRWLIENDSTSDVIHIITNRRQLIEFDYNGKLNFKITYLPKYKLPWIIKDFKKHSPEKIKNIDIYLNYYDMDDKAFIGLVLSEYDGNKKHSNIYKLEGGKKNTIIRIIKQIQLRYNFVKHQLKFHTNDIEIEDILTVKQPVIISELLKNQKISCELKMNSQYRSDINKIMRNMKYRFKNTERKHYVSKKKTKLETVNPMVDFPKKTEYVYIDAFCPRNVGNGAWGLITINHNTINEYYGRVESTIERHLEVFALYEALKHIVSRYEKNTKYTIMVNSLILHKHIYSKTNKQDLSELWEEIYSLLIYTNARVEYVKPFGNGIFDNIFAVNVVKLTRNLMGHKFA